MCGTNHQDLAHDFVLPTLLFCMLGAMTWAVRLRRGWRDECSRGSGAYLGCGLVVPGSGPRLHVVLFVASTVIVFDYQFVKIHRFSIDQQDQ